MSDEKVPGLISRLAAKNGERIKAMRESLGLTQAQLAEKVRTTQQTVDRIERGETAQSKFVPEILKALGVERGQRAPTEQELADDIRSIGQVLSSNLSDRHRPNAPPIIHSEFIEILPDEMPVYILQEVGALKLLPDAVQAIVRPPPLVRVRNAYGVLINTKAMYPSLRPGDIALVHPHLPPRVRDEVLFRASPKSEDVDIGVLLGEPEAVPGADWHFMQWQEDHEDQFLSTLEYPIAHVIIGKYNRSF